MIQQRRCARVKPSGRVSQVGKIMVDPKSPSVDVTLVDISASGACLELMGRGDIPKRFTLFHAGTKKSCRVVWIKGRTVGVTF